MNLYGLKNSITISNALCYMNQFERKCTNKKSDSNEPLFSYLFLAYSISQTTVTASCKSISCGDKLKSVPFINSAPAYIRISDL